MAKQRKEKMGLSSNEFIRLGALTNADAGRRLPQQCRMGLATVAMMILCLSKLASIMIHPELSDDSLDYGNGDTQES